jgi:hypothetical protein
MLLASRRKGAPSTEHRSIHLRTHYPLIPTVLLVING